MIALDHVTLVKNGNVLLSNVSLEVGAERVALVGPSGAGKSMLLRAVLGFESLASGTVRIGSVLATDGPRLLVDPEKRNAAMVFQDLALWPHLSVAGNLAFGLAARGVRASERDERIRTMLRAVDLETRADRKPDELSGGERQRVAIARALVLEPAVVLFDEPLANLDVVLKAELVALITRLSTERALPTLYVTHDPLEAGAIADRIAVIENGKLVQSGRPHELAGAPATPFVEAFARAMQAGRPS